MLFRSMVVIDRQMFLLRAARVKKRDHLIKAIAARILAELQVQAVVIEVQAVTVSLYLYHYSLYLYHYTSHDGLASILRASAKGFRMNTQLSIPLKIPEYSTVVQ